ncbi:endonuclease/exonuclease/phosphatase family protein [Nocardioides dongxiaopingii]|uniref:endonuclease/exonuclease/phosphatase family protein n=1 Tax=Nocardioides sp. S-1144 TaxID=2582905 RepID=UPI001652AFD7|nr:endonuclease/exonuclease/phosphatase family protein [Nocardioides sp. S-1144]
MGARRSLTTATVRVRTAVAAAAVAAVALTTAAVPTGAAAPAAAPASAPATAARAAAVTPSPIMMTHANIYTGLNVKRFQADVRTVLAPLPDFVTYNEVPFRTDAVMAPSGYDIHRSSTNRYTSATAVAWRTDRWTMVAEGTYRLSNWRGKPPGRVTELGRRFANWVTLQDLEGRTLSVVAVHVAPNVRGMPDLARPSVTRLGGLVEKLAPSGPVLVGGDFNFHYRSSRYPSDLLSAAQLEPTFDTLGSYFATGDHHGATIDYIFNRGAGVLAPDQHFSTELNSDHDAVTAGFHWLGDAPTDTQVVTNDPSGDEAARRAVLRSLTTGIRSAQSGDVVRVVTSRLDLYFLVKELRRAAKRGVQVQFVKLGRAWAPREQKLDGLLTRRGVRGSWVRQCTRTCVQEWKGQARATTGSMNGLLQVRLASGSEVRWDTSRQFSTPLLTEASSVRVSTGAEALDEGRRLFALVARNAG